MVAMHKLLITAFSWPYFLLQSWRRLIKISSSYALKLRITKAVFEL